MNWFHQCPAGCNKTYLYNPQNKKAEKAKNILKKIRKKN